MRILLAIDESTYSGEAVRAVAERPWPPGTTVRVLSVVQLFVPPPAELGFYPTGNLQQAWQESAQKAKDLTSRVASSLGSKGLTVDTAVREGEPRSVIVDEAKEWGADLIVVGSHGRTGVTRLLLGSVAQSVVGHAPCSVEVVRAKPQKG
jgi:nucleotide-binding universal stress UspA family protein